MGLTHSPAQIIQLVTSPENIATPRTKILVASGTYLKILNAYIDKNIKTNCVELNAEQGSVTQTKEGEIKMKYLVMIEPCTYVLISARCR